MTNEVARGLELTVEAAAKLKAGEPITVCFREPVWPVLCWLAMLLIFIALLVLLVRGLVWWQRRTAASAVGWLASSVHWVS